MISTAAERCLLRARLGLGLLLLALPACGLSDYEERMRETQEREERFREEMKYLDEPVKVPTKKDKDDRESPVANVFFRPPKNIQPAFQAEPHNNLLWRYPPRANGGDFALVELAFGDEDKEFVKNVLGNYQASAEGTRQTVREFTLPGRDKPLVFDSWEFDNGQEGYSINVSRGGRTQVAIVYIFNRLRRDSVRKAMDLSLESLAVDGQVAAARKRYDQKSPWKLTAAPSP